MGGIFLFWSSWYLMLKLAKAWKIGFDPPIIFGENLKKIMWKVAGCFEISMKMRWKSRNWKQCKRSIEVMWLDFLKKCSRNFDSWGDSFSTGAHRQRNAGEGILSFDLIFYLYLCQHKGFICWSVDLPTQPEWVFVGQYKRRSKAIC